MSGQRILITGISSYWGGRLAQALEAEPAVDVLIGVDTADPRVELERTEFVRVGNQHALLKRIVRAAEIDTVVDTRLVVDSAATSPRLAHENNVIGTMNIIAACSGAGSPVRKLVFKSSAHYYGCEQDDPAFFTEDMRRPHPPRTSLEKDIVEAERAVADFAGRSGGCAVTILRFANGIGPDHTTSHMRYFALPAVPTILGFDPRYQFVHDDDIVGALRYTTLGDVPGVYNVAADGVLVLSEVLDLLDKPMLPILPPWGTELVAQRLLGPLGLQLTPEMLRQLRFGRGLDNRRLKAAGYQYRYTTREALIKLREEQRTKRLRADQQSEFVYEREVENFLRWSPSVRRHRGADDGDGDGAVPEADGAPLAAYDDLRAEEVLAVLPSLERDDLEQLRRYEAAHRKRTRVLSAIDRRLARA